jgi:hypothetical protein
VGVKVGRFGLLQVGKKTPDPWREMFFKEIAICVDWTGNIPANKSGHDLAKNGGVILGLGTSWRALDA